MKEKDLSGTGMSDTGVSGSLSLESLSLVLSLRLDLCFLGGATSDSSLSEPLSLLVVTLVLSEDLRFLAKNVSGPEGSESLSFDM